MYIYIIYKVYRFVPHVYMCVYIYVYIFVFVFVFAAFRVCATQPCLI